MIPLRLDEVAAAVDGRLGPATDPAQIATGLVIDSRAAAPGLLFAALPGERTDGHDHALAAAAAGAVATLAGRPVEGATVLVADVAAAMAALAAYALRRLPDLKIIGLTGSSGKTSTKDLVAGLLEPAGATIAPPGSYNNDLGVPLTALRVDASTRFLVLELGARGRGHIARLCAIAPPSIGAVLNVGSAHLGEFGSRAEIAAAKGELAEAASDLAVLNADDPLVAGMAKRARGRIVRFGESAGADVRALDVTVDAQGHARFTLAAAGEERPVRLGLVGEHQVSNALAAAAVALECGRPADQIAEGLERARPRSRWRMEIAAGPHGRTVINDAYNANPESMRAALKTLAVLGRPSAGRPARRTVAVLGPMYELGPSSAEEHEAIGRLSVRLGVGKLVVVGPDAAAIDIGACREGARGDSAMLVDSVVVDDVPAAIAMLEGELRDDDVVLIKASRAAGLERVAATLLEGADRSAPA